MPIATSTPPDAARTERTTQPTPTGTSAADATTAPAATETQVPAGTPEATPTPTIEELKLLLPTKPLSPGAIGAADEAAAAQFIADLAAAGFAGARIYVFEVGGSEDQLLVWELNEGDLATFPEDPSPLFFALLGSEAWQSASIGQLAFNYEGTDAQGPILTILTVSAATMEGLAAGTIPQDDAYSHMRYEIQRPQ